jgi:hypothetical protein
MPGLHVVLGGKATVHCVHDRQKRQVTSEEQVRALALEVGFVFKPGIHKIHHCPCCDNLFGEDGSDARYCFVCRAKPVHALGGPLAEPKGVVA